MIVGEATTTVSATPADVFDFVLDLHRYRQADHKIGRVGTIHSEGDSGTAQLEIGSPVAGPARWFLDFEGTFDVERTDESTVVTHGEVFSFKRPWRWLAEPLLRSWLENDTTEEMVRFKQLIERDDDAPASEQ